MATRGWTRRPSRGIESDAQFRSVFRLLILPALLPVLILLLTLATVAAQEPPAAPDKPEPKPPAVLELPPVEVIGATPLPTLGTPIEKYPGNVQSITGTEIEHQKPLDISDSLYRNLGSVNINTSQGNPWQNDVTYRGSSLPP